MHEKTYPSLLEFLEDNEYPKNLKPSNKFNVKILVETQVSKENISLFLISDSGEHISESVNDIKFVDKREEL
jgi:hypothetical protein